VSTSGVAPSRRSLAAASNLRRDVLATQVVTRLRKSGIRSILLKGPTICRWLYPEGDVRVYSDVDLLVEPSLLREAERVLAESGWFHPPDDPWERDGPWHARELQKPGESIPIELHRTLSGVGVSPDVAWRVLAERSIEFPLLGVSVEALDIPARALHVALHAAQDGGGRSKSSLDLRRALHRVVRSDWEGAARLAHLLQAVPAFRAGLCLEEEGATLAKQLDLPGGTTMEVALRVSGHPKSLPIEWLANRTGLQHRAVSAFRKAFPSASFMRRKYPEASRGWVGLLLAYVVRIGWLAAHFPAAYAAWRRARKEVK
jgi:hypothetical protein